MNDPSDLLKSMVIYRITNTINLKVYIGQTSRSLNERLHGYRAGLNDYFRRSIEKYGEEFFEMDVIEECDSVALLNEREEYWIRVYRSFDILFGYNMRSGGGNAAVHPRVKKMLSEKCSGWKHTDEAKRKISESQRGEKHWAFGKKHSKEHVEKIRAGHIGQVPWNKGMRGFKHSDESVENMRRAQMGRKITWGDKISKAKEKVTKTQILGFLKTNPCAKISDVLVEFNLKSRSPIYRHGGLDKLKKESNSEVLLS